MPTMAIVAWVSADTALGASDWPETVRAGMLVVPTVAMTSSWTEGRKHGGMSSIQLGSFIYICWNSLTRFGMVARPGEEYWH